MNRWLLFAGGVLACGPASRPAAPVPTVKPSLEPQTSGTTALLQAVSAPSAGVVWVSGHAAAVLRSTDGGATWERLTVPGAAGDSLQFRDVQAVDARTAFVLAAGPGARSRIYRTGDGGHIWELQFTNGDSSAFYDCFAFWDARRGLGFSDAVAGKFVVRLTEDGGASWPLVPAAALPPAQRGEGAFAASGTCVVALASRYAWIGTGAADSARVLRTADGGHTWNTSLTPIAGGTTAGLAALAFRDTLHGVALGGNVADPNARTANVAVTEDGGRTWRLATSPTFAGAVYGVAVVPGRAGWLMAVGPRGLDYSTDDGANWISLDTLAYWSVGFGSKDTGWAVGPGGRITRIVLSR
jgi:photosystem II stability/assembly factor-like uncharacterized protein